MIFKNTFINIGRSSDAVMPGQYQMLRYSWAGQLLLFLNFKIMSNQEEKNQTTERVEVSIASKISRFVDILNTDNNTQEKLHDVIYKLEHDKDVLDQADTALVTRLLNASLSLTFLLSTRNKEVLKFLDYHYE